MFVREGLLLTRVGLACGLAAAAGLSRFMTSLLFGISAVDPVTYVAVSAALASYLPSRRATRVDPVEALRAE